MARRKTKATTGLSNPKSKVNLTITPEAKSALDVITKEMGLTRSALFEGLLNGSISLSSQNSEKNIDISFNEDKSDGETISQINILEGENVDNQEEKMDSISEDLEDYKHKISVLEKEIKAQEEKNNSLEQELVKKSSEIQSLREQVKNLSTVEKAENNHNFEAKVTELKKIIDEKNSAIASLEEKISHLEQEVKKSKESDDLSVQQDLVEQLKSQIESKNRQIHDLEQAKNNAISSTRNSYDRGIQNHLTLTNEKQKTIIEHLEKRIAELESFASIGEQFLNKWRSKAY
ncbi:hypothetical protein VKI22_14470 [Cyanobacterium aponinum UTEX 3221]|uniref:hypothetical protein n=1 Tax=Cyanobacterium aponinum TaxID=379064 RepID=UPI002B4BC62D|nr:hypothetical protein [Cyanobacterium aponinum]WRL37812.1 hypothetical protein VKI22_14470 [Cyanobacterium aponinum UTEX 3221]